jgi:hypothetical protein
MINPEAIVRAVSITPTPAELEAHTALAGLAATWAKRNTAERVADALSNGLKADVAPSYVAAASPDRFH